MSDFLLEIGKNPQARKIIQSLGLPVPLPQSLERARGPYEERPLQGRAIFVGAAAGGTLTAIIAKTLAAAGGEPYLFGDLDKQPFADAGEAWGHPPRALDPATAPDASGLVFDATAIDSPDGLRALYDFFHPVMGKLRRCARVVVLGRPPERAASPAATAAQAAAQAAIDGFVRSLAKEIGRRGATANLLRVDADASARVAGPLRYLLSSRSAFITTQPIRVSNEAAPGPATEAEIPWVRPLEGKVVMVTGAARGIGEATVQLLAQEGARVIVLDRPADDAPASQVARSIHGSVLLVDVSDAAAPAKIAGELKERFGGVDVVVHNAGITRDKTLLKMKPELWDQALAVNLGSVVKITEALLAPGGALRDGGRIICLSSVAGLAGNLGQTNYAASKAGVAGYVRALAPTVAKRGITVNAVAPGFIETRLTAAIPVMIREAGRRLSALGQGGLPRDVGDLITFLASPGAQGLTGQVIRACGGALIGA
jgi:3-oxoacyl-[acyl-carrier protein] reductase